MAKDTKIKEKKEKKERKTFGRDFKAELKKVTWPTAKQLTQKTAIVIAIVLIISAIVFVLDFAFDKGYEFIITESSKVINKEDNSTNETENTTIENVTAENVENTSDNSTNTNDTENVTAE